MQPNNKEQKQRLNEKSNTEGQQSPADTNKPNVIIHRIPLVMSHLSK